MGDISFPPYEGCAVEGGDGEVLKFRHVYQPYSILLTFI